MPRSEQQRDAAINIRVWAFFIEHITSTLRARRARRSFRIDHIHTINAMRSKCLWCGWTVSTWCWAIFVCARCSRANRRFVGHRYNQTYTHHTRAHTHEKNALIYVLRLPASALDCVCVVSVCAQRTTGVAVRCGEAYILYIRIFI